LSDRYSCGTGRCPATRDGVPVRILITLDLTFLLKK
jgi:hypothetical protein